MERVLLEESEEMVWPAVVRVLAEVDCQGPACANTEDGGKGQELFGSGISFGSLWGSLIWSALVHREQLRQRVGQQIPQMRTCLVHMAVCLRAGNSSTSVGRK